MEEFEIKVDGAPVVFTTMAPPPYNPLNRPTIRYRKAIVASILWLVGLIALLWCGILWFKNLVLWTLLLWLVLSVVIFGKRALIWFIHLYQNKASDATRLKCVFEPSCSEYMILAVQKYGLFRGFFKGVRRLLRCHPPNGGKDYP